MHYISKYFLAVVVLLVFFVAMKQKVCVFECFVEGVKEAVEITIKLFPTLLALFVAVGLLRNSGVLNFFSYCISPIAHIFRIPEEVIPLFILRPISGSASLAFITDVFKNYGVDSKIGRLSSIMMGTTDTVLYIMTIYFGVTKVVNTRFVLVVALLCEVFSLYIASIIVGK